MDKTAFETGVKMGMIKVARNYALSRALSSAAGALGGAGAGALAGAGSGLASSEKSERLKSSLRGALAGAAIGGLAGGARGAMASKMSIGNIQRHLELSMSGSSRIARGIDKSTSRKIDADILNKAMREMDVKVGQGRTVGIFAGLAGAARKKKKDDDVS